MKYFSIDIETTGTNPELDQILSIGIIFEDTSLKLPFEDIPKLHLYLLHDRISGNPFSFDMNQKIINVIANYKNYKNKEITEILNQGITVVESDEAWFYLQTFIIKHIGEYFTSPKRYYINVAGKNFGTFDKLFLDKIKVEDKIRFRQGILDPGISFIDWDKDERVPSLSECKERNGDEPKVEHDAIFDAWDVINLLRKQY